VEEVAQLSAGTFEGTSAEPAGMDVTLTHQLKFLSNLDHTRAEIFGEENKKHDVATVERKTMLLSGGVQFLL